LAGPRGQFRGRPAWPHPRRVGEPARHLRARCVLDGFRRRGPLERSQRSRLRRGQREGVVLMKTANRFVAFVLALGAAGSTCGAVTAQDAAKLGADLTPMGAEKAANADGTIP